MDLVLAPGGQARPVVVALDPAGGVPIGLAVAHQPHDPLSRRSYDHDTTLPPPGERELGITWGNPWHRLWMGTPPVVPPPPDVSH